MKRLVTLFALSLIVAMSYAQRINVVTASEADSSKGAETDYQKLAKFFDGENLIIQSLFTELGGTTDGTVEVMQSIDGTSYELVPDELVTTVTSDTATMVDGGVKLWRINDAQGLYQLKISGTSGDTTLITTKYHWTK
jgi:hypothetical protein